LESDDALEAIRARVAEAAAWRDTLAKADRERQQAALHREVVSCGGALRALPSWPKWPLSRAWVWGSVRRTFAVQVRHDVHWATRTEASCSRGDAEACLRLARVGADAVPARWLTSRPAVGAAARRALDTALGTFEAEAQPCFSAADAVSTLSGARLDAASRLCVAAGGAWETVRRTVGQLPPEVADPAVGAARDRLDSATLRIERRAEFLGVQRACVDGADGEACGRAERYADVASPEERQQLTRVGAALLAQRADAAQRAARGAERAERALDDLVGACRQDRASPNPKSATSWDRARAVVLADIATYVPAREPEARRAIDAACGVP
jgi:hypothetical protein